MIAEAAIDIVSAVAPASVKMYVWSYECWADETMVLPDQIL